MSMTDRQLAYEAYRIRTMQNRLEDAERKLAGLYREARRYGLSAILDMPSATNAAWERRILIAQLDAAERGQDYTMDDKRGRE